ncbi:hypothetical protein [Streptomyces sp. NPDC006012]|uniref:hypothetical protein n=1 Tax=Streptomyces sp. NPDC006012 TaxID=3364739 RepID=UPI00367C1551
MRYTISDEALEVVLNSREPGNLPKPKELVTVTVKGKSEAFVFYSWFYTQISTGRTRSYSPNLIKALEKHGWVPERIGDRVGLKVKESQIMSGDCGSGNSQGRAGESSRAPQARETGGNPAGQSRAGDACLDSWESNYEDWLRQFPGLAVDPFFGLGYPRVADVSLGLPDGLVGPGTQGLSTQPDGSFNPTFAPRAWGTQSQFGTGMPYAPNITGINNPLAPHAWGTQPQSGTGMPYNPDIGDITGMNSPFAGRSRGTQPQFGRTDRQRQSSSQGERTDQQWQAPSQGKGKASRR